MNLAGACAVLIGALAVGAEPQGKNGVYSFKVTSVDVKTRRLEVKESGYEVVWEEGKVSFYHHRSIPLKDLREGTKVEIHGKLHDANGASKTSSYSDPLISDVDCIGTGSKFMRPEIPARMAGVNWEQGTLRGKPLFSAEIGKNTFRIAGDNKLAVYSVESLEPPKLKGVKVQIIGTSKKVTVERKGKPVELTRIFAQEVHLVELNPQHEKLFRLAWVERKQEPPPGEPASEPEEKKSGGEGGAGKGEKAR